MFHDVHQETDKHLLQQRVPGAEFDEVTYADDTICITTETKAMNKFLEAIEWEGFRYGLKLNKKNVNSSQHIKMQIYTSKIKPKY